MAKKKTYSVAEARAALPGILNEVSAGADVYLTRRGQRVAVVVSTRTYERLSGASTSFAATFRSFNERRAAKARTFDAAFFGALRDRSPGRRGRM